MDHMRRVKRTFHKKLCVVLPDNPRSVQEKFSQNCGFEVPLPFQDRSITLPSFPRPPPCALSGAYLSCADITCFTSASVAVGNLFNAASAKEDKPSAEENYISYLKKTFFKTDFLPFFPQTVVKVASTTFR